MKVSVGIDLGSTTTKAVILDEQARVVGRGITNSRSNYDVACSIAREEAFVRARFTLAQNALEQDPTLTGLGKAFLSSLGRAFRLHQHLDQLEQLRAALQQAAEAPRHESQRAELRRRVDAIVDTLAARAPELYGELAIRKSDFFRDLAAAEYMNLAQKHSDPKGVTFETLCGLFDAAILQVENSRVCWP